jgi:hypothetical protein
MSISHGDLKAMADVLIQLADESDGLSLEDGLGLLADLDSVGQCVKATSSIIESEVKRRLEGGSQQIGTSIFWLGQKGVDRWDHDEVARRVIDRLRVDRETGEIRDVSAAIEAWRLFRDIYLSPSTQGKKTALAALTDEADLEGAGLLRWERNGTRIKSKEITDD